MNEPMLKKMQAAPINSTEFFARSQARLNFDVPPGLVDPEIIPKTGDEGNDRMTVMRRASSSFSRHSASATAQNLRAESRTAVATWCEVNGPNSPANSDVTLCQAISGRP